MKRERLTITLKSELLKLLDRFVDGEKIRNRSHAVEFLLSQSLAQNQIKVLILAGGKGIKFREFPGELSRAMVSIEGHPLLARTIKRLKSFGLSNIVLSVGQHGESIKDYFGNGERWGVKISYLDQHQKTPGTAQPVKQAEREFFSTFLLIYGDVFSNLNFQDVIEFHNSQKHPIATMALTSVEHVSQWGVARLAGTKIVDFQEKPQRPSTHSHLVNAGMYVLEPAIFKYITDQDVRLESTIFPRLAEEGKLGGYAFEGNWQDISNAEVYNKVIKNK